MTSKNLIGINLGGGMDGLNAVSYRDARSVGFIQTARQSAPGNVLDYAESPSRVTTLVRNSSTFTVSDTTGLSVGDLCYGIALPRVRKLTVTSIVGNTVTLSGASYSDASNTTVYFGSSTELFKMNENPPITSAGNIANPGLHRNLRWLADAFNIPNAGNPSKTKAAVISNIGPMITKYYKTTNENGIFVMDTDNGVGGRRRVLPQEEVKNLTSHNDQTSTWLANAPEGAVEGWGGGIADAFINALPTDEMKGLAAVTLEPGTPYTSGTTTISYNASGNAILLQYPGYTTTAWPGGKENQQTQDELTELVRQAARLDPITYDNDFHVSVTRFNETAEQYQPLFNNAPEITNFPTNVGSATLLMKNMKQILRIMLMNNPNRGFTFTRVGNTVTAETQVSNGTVTRVDGSTTALVTCAGHGLFTTNATGNGSDRVLIVGADISPPANGYNITLTPGDEDNSFTITTTDSTPLTNAAVTVRLKHNFSTSNSVFIKDTTHAIDSTIPEGGFRVQTVPNNYTFTFTTAVSGSYASANTGFAKLLDLDKQVFYTNTPGFSWDTHDSTNDQALLNLDRALEYFDSVASRIVNANYVGFTITEFGRTYTTNATGGTDHGWGNYAFVFGREVNGNQIYGEPLDYDPSGPSIASGLLLPTTSVYQYGATLAKWMGSTDAEVLELFPKLINWPVNQRYLGFL